MSDPDFDPAEPVPTPKPTRLPVRASDLLLILILALGSARILALVLVGFLPEPGAEGRGGAVVWLVVTTFLVQAVLVLGLLRFLVIRKYGLRWADLGLRPAAREWYRRGAIAAVALLPVVAAINAVLIPAITDQPFRNPQVTAIAPSGFDWSTLLIMLVMGGVVAPFAEELAFRGLLFPWLRDRIGFAAGALVSGLGFAALHGVLVLIPALAVVGIVLAWLYERSGSLWPAIIAHGTFNGVMILMLYALLALGVGLP